MKKQVGKTRDHGYATVSLGDDHIIICEMHGFIDQAIARRSVDQTMSYAETLRAQNLPSRLLIDATGVTGQTSGARSVAKELGSKQLDRVAICNHNVALGFIIRYLVRAAGISDYTRIFRSPILAKRWLLRGADTPQTPYRTLRTVVASLVIVLAGSALVGWASHSEILTAIIPGRKPLNPVEAVLLLLLAVSLLFIRKAGDTSTRRKYFIASIAFLAIGFGVAILLQNALHVDLHVDDWLYSRSLDQWSLSGSASPRTSFLIAVIGVMELAILTGQKLRWQKLLFHIPSVLLFVISLGAVVGNGFHVGGLYLVPQLPMSLSAAMCLLLLNHGLQAVCDPIPVFGRLWQRSNAYSQAIFIFLVIVLITGISWQQARSDQQVATSGAAKEQFTQTKTVLNDRVNGYVNALRGYRSFFESSDFVSAPEFQTYFQSSNLAQDYPGFNALVFAPNVPAAQRASYIISLRQQASSDFPNYKTVSIFPASDNAISYPATYVAPQKPTTTYGFDLATDTTRRLALEKARDTAAIVATGTIDLNASRAGQGLPMRPGFYLVVPIYKGTDLPTDGLPTSLAQRRATIYGFVNAVFEDSNLFGDIFKDYQHSDIVFEVRNAASGTILYRSSPHAPHTNNVAYEGTLSVAGEVWKLDLYTPANFGVHGINRVLPSLLLAGGLALAVLSSALAAGQSRRKEQAVSLASSMTEDLNNERNAAVLQREKDEAILSSIGDAVFAVDATGKIILFNAVAERLSGYQAKEVINKPFAQVLAFYNEKNGSPANGFIETALRGAKAEMAQNTVLRRKDGDVVPVSDSAAPIFDSSGNVDGVVVVFRDVRRERELMKMKDDFVSIASHELRTPMGAVRAFVSMILSGDYGPVNKNLVEPLTDIKNSTLRLVTLVNDLLDAARIEAGRMRFSLQDIDAATVIQEVTSSLAPLGREKGVEITAGKTEPLQVQADPDKLKQVLTNLVGNALKFTDKGSIIVTLTAQPQTAEIIVTDTGMGIRPEDQSALFGKFQQISSAQQGRPAGTGLGLYISREIIQKQGGDLWLKRSAAGVGSTFALTLPRSGTIEAKRVGEALTREAGIHPDQQ